MKPNECSYYRGVAFSPSRQAIICDLSVLLGTRPFDASVAFVSGSVSWAGSHFGSRVHSSRGLRDVEDRVARLVRLPQVGGSVGR